MTLAQVAVGQRLRASVVNGWITQINNLSPLLAVKTADETVNNSATLQNDDVLLLSVPASATYRLTCQLIQNSNATANFKLDLTMPTGSTWRPGKFACGASAATLQFGVMSGASISGITGIAADSVVSFETIIVIGGTAGTVQLRWAQNTANASNTIVRAGSYLILDRTS